MNVTLNPFQCSSLIQETGVRDTMLFDLGAGEKAKCSQAVLNRDEDDGAGGCVDQSVAGIAHRATDGVASAVKAHHDRKTGRLGM